MPANRRPDDQVSALFSRRRFCSTMARRILVPMDGSPKARAGLEHALSTYPEADLTVLHVMAPYDRWDEQDPPLPTEVADEWYDAARERAEAVFAQARAMADEHGIDVSTVLEVGEAWRVIVDYAEEEDVDHIVLGSHGRPAGASIRLGSVAETVARRAPGLVSIVR